MTLKYLKLSVALLAIVSSKTYAGGYPENINSSITKIAFKLNLADTVQDSLHLITAEGAKPRLISHQFSFTEGPAVDKKGNVFFTDQPNDQIWEYSTDGKLALFMDHAGRSNGMYFDKKGNLIACADEHDQLWSISPDKKVTVLVKDYQGRRLNGPNDVWVDPKGGMYMTDPYYQRPYWDRTKPDIEGKKVYYLAPDKTTLTVVDGDFVQPNGIVGTKDGKYLYVADIVARKTYKYTINKDGSLSDRHLFVQQGSDGMTLDDHGNVYLTGKGVTVYNPKGEKIAYIELPDRQTTNLCFGGKHKDELFITAVKGIYVLKTKVRGIE
jgi:gluconolactonase